MSDKKKVNNAKHQVANSLVKESQSKFDTRLVLTSLPKINNATRVLFFSNMVRKVLSSSHIFTPSSIEPNPLVDKALVKQNVSFARNLSRDIFGTQSPRLKLRSNAQYPSTTVTTGAFAVVYAVQLADLIEFAAFQAIFEEYKFVGPITYRMHGYYSIMIGWYVVVIDYDSSSALASFNEGLSYDSHKLLPLSAIVNSNQYKPHEIKAHVMPLPDQDWRPVASDTYVPCYWKSFSSITQGTNATATGVCIMYAEPLLQFRQLTG